ncbi:MAG: ACP S-malonyltransferase [Candidatus Cloacimonadota bacterium]|nr:ACP S-malonyltransferase [Candidatus Cloacimonadota bacterium]
MSKIGFIFPGQGSQYVGMAEDFINNNSQLRKIMQNFETRNEVNLSDIMINGPEEKLKETRFTQPAILFHSIAALRTLQAELDLDPDFVAGHSLGEFSALVANNVLNLEDAMYLVHKRGEYMIKANEGKPFGMAAIIGLDPQKVEEICKKASQTDIVIAANFNTPVQTVISGSKVGVDKASHMAKEAGAKRIVPLEVGGPFHSPLIKKAEQWLIQEMKNIFFTPSYIPVISNVDAQPTIHPQKIKENLAKQVTSSVRWLESVQFMIDQGVDLFIEFGPQKVLAGMMRKINRKVKVISFGKLEELETVKSKIIEILKQKFEEAIQRVTIKKEELNQVLRKIVKEIDNEESKLADELKPINFYLKPQSSLMRVLEYVSNNHSDIYIDDREKFQKDMEEYKNNFEHAFNIIKRLKESGLETNEMNKRLMDIFFKDINWLLNEE